ncbi:MAG: alkene reductase [Pseudomonadota bacterium]
MSDDILFTPGHLGDLSLRNRIVLAPLTRSRADANGVPSDLAPEYYAQRAGAGLIITEATQISFEGMGYPRTPGVHTPEQFASWKPIIEAVHAKGSKIVAQLWHVGRIAAHANRGVKADVVAPSDSRAPGEMYTDDEGMVPHDRPRALETDEIARIAAEYAEAAEKAIAAGFDGVELHSANGYLLHQFLSTNVNTRTDRYGGSIENRIRMPLEVLDAILEKVPARKVGIRVSPRHTFNGIEEADSDQLYAAYYEELSRRGLAYLHVMRAFTHELDTDIVAFADQHYAGDILVCGEYTKEEGAEVLNAGHAKAVAYGRPFIANPDLVERFRKDAPLNEPDSDTFYTPGPKGYIDYPTLEEVGA